MKKLFLTFIVFAQLLNANAQSSSSPSKNETFPPSKDPSSVDSKTVESFPQTQNPELAIKPKTKASWETFINDGGDNLKEQIEIAKVLGYTFKENEAVEVYTLDSEPKSIAGKISYFFNNEKYGEIVYQKSKLVKKTDEVYWNMLKPDPTVRTGNTSKLFSWPCTASWSSWYNVGNTYCGFVLFCPGLHIAKKQNQDRKRQCNSGVQKMSRQIIIHCACY
jgi:hypothetical protein